MDAIPPMPPSPTAKPKMQGGPILTLIGGVGIVLGSFLPWATITTGLGSASVTGMEGDGVITLGLGAAIAIMGLLELTNGSNTKMWALVLSIGAGVLGVFEMQNAREVTASASSAFARASVGIGIWAIMAGAGVAFLGGMLSRDPESPRPLSRG